MIGAALHAALLLGPPALWGTLDGRAALLALAWVVAGAAEARHTAPRLPARGLEPPWLSPLTAGALLAGTLAALLLPGDLGLELPGAAMLIGGLCLRAWAIRTLGPWFLHEVRWMPGQPHLRTGPYRLLRHPAAAGLAIAALGGALLTGSVAALALWPVLAGAVALRTRLEDAVIPRMAP